MKKVFLSLAVLASVAMVSCNKKAAEGEATEGQNVENNDSISSVNDSVAPAANDSIEVVEETVVAVEGTDSVQG